jgi:MYXO-CTERM domain-containing protein
MRKPFAMTRATALVSALALAACSSSPEDAPGDLGAQSALRRESTRHPMTLSVQYYGGPVISNVQVVAVLWGSGVNVEIQQGIGPFYQTITASPYIDWLSEYDTTGTPGQTIGRGSFATLVTITPSTTSTSLQDSDISAELIHQIQSNKLPAPTKDAAGNVNTVYMVELPPAISVTANGKRSCVTGGLCAYHGTATMAGTDIYYGVFPDIYPGCAASCGSNVVSFSNVTARHSEQLGSMITDPEVGLATSLGPPMGWNGASGEIGPICSNGSPTEDGNVGGYIVQKLWSNALNTCIATNPNIGPPDGGSDAGSTDASSTDASAGDAAESDASEKDVVIVDGPAETSETGSDEAGQIDAGTGIDSGGSAPDAATANDAGATFDAIAPPPDSATEDGGPDAEGDGAATGGGSGSNGGCGCRASGESPLSHASPWLLGALVLTLGVRRRTRR